MTSDAPGLNDDPFVAQKLHEATLGDNSNDPHALAMADISARMEAFMKGADVWETRGKLKDDEIGALDDLDHVGAKLNDFMTGARTLWAEADKARAAEKKPFLESGRAVDSKWAPILTKLEAVGEIAKKLAKRILAAQATRQRIAREKAEAEQRAAEEAAEKARREALEAGNVKDRLDAQARADEAAEIAERAAGDVEANSGKARLQSATGHARTRALRTIRKARIVSLPKALSYFRNSPEISATILQLAERELRSAPVERGVKRIPIIPGIVFDESEEV